VAANASGESSFDVVVIGGGPGGYVAAIRAAQLGLHTACVEVDKMGGVCLNIGCIPTKALLSSSHLVHELKNADKHGITFDNIKVDYAPAQKRSRSVADQMSRGVAFLMKKHKVEVIDGYGRLAGKNAVEVDKDGAKRTLTAKNIIIATGSRPRSLPFMPIDEDRIWSSTGALFHTDAPGSVAVIGAGAVGMEFADVFSAFGTQVTVIEAMDRVLPIEDADCSKVVQMSFKKRKIAIHTEARVEEAEVSSTGVKLTFTDKKGETRVLEVDHVLSAVGRIPNTEDLGLDKAGLKVSERGGFIEIDGVGRTAVDSVWAVGDCAGNALLAHKAMHEGVVVAEHIAGVGHHTVDHSNVPSCTYCHPEVASVGLTEAQALEQGLDIEVGKFPWAGNGRAVAGGDATGFVKVIRDTQYSEIVGAHIVGPQATELIAEFVLGRHLEATVEEMDLAMHPHPTLSEAVAEGALSALGRALHA